MKKLYIWSILTLIITTFLPSALLAQKSTFAYNASNTAQRETHVTPAQALNVGYTFMRTSAGNGTRGSGAKSSAVRKQAMQLVYTGQAYDSLTGTTTDCYYVFALQPKGFVIVAADERVEPILGYSYDNNFVVEGMPDHVRGWLGHYEKQIEAVTKSDIQAEPATQTKWTRLKSGQPISTRNGNSVGPLITTQWDQWWPYNSLCPAVAPTGCVATATAQIMNYWRYPVKGIGYREYSSPSYVIGHHHVAYNETYYQWDSMDVQHPDAIGTLMYHVGTSCETHYYFGVSGSSIESAMIGMQTYFDYSDNLQYLRKINTSYTDSEWEQLIKDNLNDSMPVLYAGGTTVGHAWVIDGYDTDGLFHMNFGWSGSYDGYYALDMIYTSYNLSDDQSMVINIAPANTTTINSDFQYAVDDYNEMAYTFHDFSKGLYDALTWDFGDGSSDSTYNPAHTYISDSLYTVTLVAHSGSLTDTVVKHIDIRHNRYLRRVPPLTGDPSSNPVGSIIPMDYDMDGRQDIIVHGLDGVFLNHNTETGFVNNEIILTTSDSYDLQVVDLYNTNKPALYSASNASHWNNINGQFVLDTAIDLSRRGYFVDYDNDGLVDLIGTNDAGGDGTIYKNIGKGKFFKVCDNFPRGTWYDVDKDGDLDLITPFQGTSINHIAQYNCINDGHGLFHEEDYPAGLWGDFNGDGLPDVFANITGDVNSAKRTLLINMGNNVYDTLYSTTLDYYMENLGTNGDGEVAFWAWPNSIHEYADFDNDGYIEVLYGVGTDYGQCDSIIKIVGDSIAKIKNDYHIPVLSLADPDGNSSIDVLSAVAWPWSDNHMGTYMNISTTANTPPVAPAGLSVDIYDNDVILHWEAPTDDHTPSATLTYNIAVGTTPESCDIYSPLSDLSTGKRYVMDRGNAGLATQWRVNDLPNDTYYWRVQAIDQALAASPFSVVGTFTINGNNIPPAMAEMKSGFVFGKDNYFDKVLFLDAYVDRDNDSLSSIRICSLPNYGTLSLHGSAVQIGQLIPFNDLDSLCYHNNNYLNARDTLYVKPSDGYDFSNYLSPIYLSGKLFEQVAVTLPNGKGLWGDFDNDGDLDLATTEGIYQNTQGSYNAIHTFAENKTPLAWIDYNNDNRLDCLYADTLWVNDGTGGFVAQTMNIGDWADKLDFNDINNNNNIDFVYVRNDSLFVRYDWSEDVSLDIQAMRDGGIALGDWDNNGRLDLANTGFDWGNHRAMTVYRDSTDRFVPAMSLEGLSVGNLQWGDYDKDGDLDMLVTGSDNNSIPYATLYNNHHGVFIQQETALAGIYGNAYWFDFDNDGWLDVILSGYYVGTLLYRNNQDGTFTEISPDVSQIPTEVHSIAIGDYDNDGFMDILLSGTYLMRNMLGSASNNLISAPTSPVQLQSDVQGNHVKLSWHPSESSNHHSYNVYVRKEGDTNFVVSPLADTITGFRKVVRIGNAEYRTFFDLNSLTEGTYWWSVQSVDNAFHGGTFAPEQSFTITCQPSDPIHVYDTVCHAYSYYNDVLSENGTYTTVYPSHDGCDSTVYLHLTVLDDCSAIVYVKENGSDNNNGYSWQTAKATIASAMELAQQNGDTVVWVATGTYFGDSLFCHAFDIPDGIRLYGGFSGNEPEDFNLFHRDFINNPTILDGKGNNNVVGLNDNSILDGFVVQNGGWNNGYGIDCYMGGGIYANSTAIVRNSIVKNNRSVWSAGVWGGSVINCLIIGNTTMYRGTVESCHVINSTIANNYGDQQYFEHIPIAGTANSQLTNCILWNNQFTTIENCTLSFCATDADFMEGTGNILIAHGNDGTSSDSNYVRFVDPEHGNFRLAYGSACINAGTPDISVLGLSSVDLQGLPRVLDGRIDMGAYEYYPVPTYHTYDTMCEGGSVTFQDSVYAISGTYTRHTSSNPLEDTAYVLHLTVNPADTADFAETACESYEWGGEIFTTSGDYSRTLTNANGCDSVVTLHLTINSAYHTDMHVSACDSYVWNNQTYSASGNYDQTFTAANGCDSVVSLNLTIFPADSADFAETACDSFEWNGETFTTSGDYSRTLTNANGCDSVVTLHLTINPSEASEFTITTPDSCYTWNSQTYCTSGDYTQTLQTVHGCDSVVTLHLTITVGIEDHNLGASMTVYPNPTTGIVNVECTMDDVEMGTVEFQLFDAFGRLLRITDGVETRHGTSLQTAQIDLSRFAAGVYFIKAVSDGNVVAVRKLIKN